MRLQLYRFKKIIPVRLDGDDFFDYHKVILLEPYSLARLCGDALGVES